MEQNGSIEKIQIDDAESQKVTLRGAIAPKGKELSVPEREWLNEFSAAYYHHLFNDTSYNFIIGHAPFFVFGAENLKRVYKGENIPKVVLFMHRLPKTTHGHLKRDALCDWISGTDIFFSIGEAIRNDLNRFVYGMEHELYIPLGHLKVPSELAIVPQAMDKTDRLITMVVGSQDVRNNSLDVRLGVAAAIKAVENIQSHRKSGTQINKHLRLAIFVEQAKDEENLRETFRSSFPNAPSNMLTFHRTTHLQSFLLKSSVLLLPLKKLHPQFGLEALNAAVAGVPILVSGNSGVAALLCKIGETESIVPYFDTDIWTDRIVKKVLDPDTAREHAQRLKQNLLQNPTFGGTHAKFISRITGEYDLCHFIPEY